MSDLASAYRVNGNILESINDPRGKTIVASPVLVKITGTTPLGPTFYLSTSLKQIITDLQQKVYRSILAENNIAKITGINNRTLDPSNVSVPFSMINQFIEFPLNKVINARMCYTSAINFMTRDNSSYTAGNNYDASILFKIEYVADCVGSMVLYTQLRIDPKWNTNRVEGQARDIDSETFTLYKSSIVSQTSNTYNTTSISGKDINCIQYAYGKDFIYEYITKIRVSLHETSNYFQSIPNFMLKIYNSILVDTGVAEMYQRLAREDLFVISHDPRRPYGDFKYGYRRTSGNTYNTVQSANPNRIIDVDGQPQKEDYTICMYWNDKRVMGVSSTADNIGGEYATGLNGLNVNYGLNGNVASLYGVQDSASQQVFTITGFANNSSILCMPVAATYGTITADATTGAGVWGQDLRAYVPSENVGEFIEGAAPGNITIYTSDNIYANNYVAYKNLLQPLSDLITTCIIQPGAVTNEYLTSDVLISNESTDTLNPQFVLTPIDTLLSTYEDVFPQPFKNMFITEEGQKAQFDAGLMVYCISNLSLASRIREYQRTDNSKDVLIKINLKPTTSAVAPLSNNNIFNVYLPRKQITLNNLTTSIINSLKSVINGVFTLGSRPSVLNNFRNNIKIGTKGLELNYYDKFNNGTTYLETVLNPFEGNDVLLNAADIYGYNQGTPANIANAVYNAYLLNTRESEEYAPTIQNIDYISIHTYRKMHGLVDFYVPLTILFFCQGVESAYPHIATVSNKIHIYVEFDNPLKYIYTTMTVRPTALDKQDTENKDRFLMNAVRADQFFTVNKDTVYHKLYYITYTFPLEMQSILVNYTSYFWVIRDYTTMTIQSNQTINDYGSMITGNDNKLSLQINKSSFIDKIYMLALNKQSYNSISASSNQYAGFINFYDIYLCDLLNYKVNGNYTSPLGVAYDGDYVHAIQQYMLSPAFLTPFISTSITSGTAMEISLNLPARLAQCADYIFNNKDKEYACPKINNLYEFSFSADYNSMIPTNFYIPSYGPVIYLNINYNRCNGGYVVILSLLNIVTIINHNCLIKFNTGNN
ncbi:MAG: hypothetical protein IKA36_00770 [Clostridia bacterium]|nr:hypothetical protein [Clostridia bacterium]